MNKSIASFITKVKNYYWVLNMKLYKRKADRLHKITGSQFFIIMFQGKITIVSKEWFKEQRQQGKFPMNFNANNLKAISYYFTKS